MAAHSESFSWKQKLLIQLKQRNKHQTQTYASLIQSNNKLQEQVSTLRSKSVHSQVEAERLREENLNLRVRIESVRNQNPDFYDYDVTFMKQKVRQVSLVPDKI